jgi:NAD-dependent dihydropyrimidine dehydrogenase PreA subunit
MKMPKKEVYALPNVISPGNPIFYDAEKCNGCNTCVNHCQVDVLIPNPEKGKPPVILHPDECWYCGVCVNDCSQEAITFNWPLQQRGYWKDKKTGKVMRDLQ